MRREAVFESSLVHICPFLELKDPSLHETARSQPSESLSKKDSAFFVTMLYVSGA